MVPVPTNPTFMSASSGSLAGASGYDVGWARNRQGDMLRGILAIALAATSWGTTGAATAVLVAQAGAHPLLIGAVRMGVAAALLLAGARLVAGTLRVSRADRARCLATGACMAAFQVAYFTAVTLSGIAVTALVAICSAPLLIALLARLWLGEPLSGRTLGALALGVAGTALLVAGPGRGAGPDPPRLLAGVVLALGAGLAYALYVIVTKLGLSHAAPLPLTAATFTAAALLMIPAFALVEAPMTQVARGWPWLLYLGAVATAGAYALYATGLALVPATVAGLVSLMEPLTATLLGVLLFGERLGALGALGALLMLAALAVALTRPRRPASPDSRPEGPTRSGAPGRPGTRA
jgi:DME family drug/metabolite transporter